MLGFMNEICVKRNWVHLSVPGKTYFSMAGDNGKPLLF